MSLVLAVLGKTRQILGQNSARWTVGEGAVDFACKKKKPMKKKETKTKKKVCPIKVERNHHKQEQPTQQKHTNISQNMAETAKGSGKATSRSDKEAAAQGSNHRRNLVLLFIFVTGIKLLLFPA
jgi:thiol:disulfide interchange protein